LNLESEFGFGPTRTRKKIMIYGTVKKKVNSFL